MTHVQITDVFLRDGLQDEDVVVPVRQRIRVSQLLADAGVRRVEAGSFVSDSRMPQMAGAAELVPGLPVGGSTTFTFLALNGRGIERAVSAGATHVSLAASASEAHSVENSGRGNTEILSGLARGVAEYPAIRFAANVATAFTCPFEGDIPPARLISVVGEFVEMGITDIGLADTLGNTPTEVLIRTLGEVRQAYPDIDIGLHLHNAHGQAIETAIQAVEIGVLQFDAALAGFGGCPFAPGAAGNVATEALVAAFHAAGHDTGIDESRLAEAAAEARRVVAEGAPVHLRPGS